MKEKIETILGILSAILIIALMVLGIVALTTLEKQNKPNYYKPQEINITIDKDFNENEIELITKAIEQYTELELFKIGSLTIGKFDKKADVMITPMRDEKQYYDSDAFPNNLGCNYTKVRIGKIKKSIITINTKLLTVYANTQARANSHLVSEEITFNHLYSLYITSVTLHEFGHTLGLVDLYEEEYFNASVMYFANYELAILSDFDYGMLVSKYYKK